MKSKAIVSGRQRSVTSPDLRTKRQSSLNNAFKCTVLFIHVRQLIHNADPDVQEEWKWEKESSPGTPVWSHDGGVCTGESYKQVVKLTFFRGASLNDPKKLFNSSLEGNTRRAIDLHEGEKIDEAAFKQLIRVAVEANSAARAPRAAKKK
jgi:hypothetical protein